MRINLPCGERLAHCHPLARRVMAVAVVDEGVGEWAAYISSTVGLHHRDEIEGIASHGDKLSEVIAAAIFPDVAASYGWRK